MSFSTTVSLATGTLKVSAHESSALFKHYIDFAARNNPKRGFLFVSKVLGKHYPCKASVMQDSYTQLNKLLDATNLGTCVFIGMAETATALGLGVYETWCQSNNSKTGIYLQTSRYFLADHEYVNFEEAHSHATGFYLYLPTNPADLQCFQQAETLILIDDEISTGNTFANLINAYKCHNPNLKRVIVMSLLNLTSAISRQNVATKTNIKVEWLSILSGQFEFTPKTDYQFTSINLNSSAKCKQHLLGSNFGRLGINQSLPSLTGIDKFSANLTTNAKILLVGTGEFIYHAYLIALKLEQQGFETYVQSTTRSPILIGNAIQNCLEFQDNYEDGIPNYLYNYQADQYDAVAIVHETPKNAALNHLSKLLNATTLKVNNGTVSIS